MKRMLMIVDPQVDFAKGTLPVPRAAEAMEKLAGYINGKNSEYACLVVTGDWHPVGHCSFRENGGSWPAHCLQESAGAAIFEPLREALGQTPTPMEILRKGMDKDHEEYSVFRNAAAASRIGQLVQDMDIGRINLCGIAGDVCVLDTLKDGISLYGTSMFHVLEEYSPSLDGGTALSETIHTLLQP